MTTGVEAGARVIEPVNQRAEPEEHGVDGEREREVKFDLVVLQSAA